VSGPQHTPLDAVHRSLGATMVDFAGWWMPLRYRSETAEHLAVRSAAGLFDLSHMGEIAVTGPGAPGALDYALVGDLGGLAVGRARYTMLCAPDGGILDDLIVYRLDTAQYLVVANAVNAGVVARSLAERAVGFDAEVRDVGAAWALLAVQGPAATKILGPLADVELAEVRYYSGTPATVAGTEVVLARTGYTGEDGFELFCPPMAAPALWSALDQAGTEHGLIPCGLACRDTLRLEAGMPLYGHELRADLTPAEAGLGRVVAWDKPGGFVGRAALEHRAAQPPVRALVGLVSAGRRVPRAGYPVLAGGEVVGEVTSGASSPTLGKPIAMAYLGPDWAAPGTEVAVDIRGRVEPAEVVSLPFYRRPRS
jgi:aminomethyltransferase